ncbi:MAG: putative lipoprotein, partial [Myxococcaceae bacterium]|nr:putative lipoprotein [Myxococcaceae bacterium]
MRSFVLCAVVVLAGCRQPPLNSSLGSVSVTPETLDFGAVYTAQETRTLTFRLTNDGRANLALEWSRPESPFHAMSLPDVVPSGETEISVVFAPAKDGKFKSTIQVQSEGQPPRIISLLGESLPVPTCPGTEACLVSSFDLQLKRCVEQPQPDGTSCTDSSVCLTNATCQSGRCIGVEKSCDDQNRCTLDTCNAVIGCEHLPAPPCPGDGQCQVGTCNPATGCGMEDAEDGMACGAIQTCQAAQVCISGSCVIRDPPDGYVCAEASPCQAEGLCAGDVCVRPAATTLTPNWNFDSLKADAGVGNVPPQLHDLVLEPSGALSLSGFFHTAPQLRVNTPAAKEARLGAARRCMLWNGRMICADYPASVNGKVSAIDLATGELLWTFNLHTARPDFQALSSSLFMARMAVQGSDRMAALFEAYPRSSDATKPTNCRLYFLVVLDASGTLVTAQQVVDPVLSVCNHPHPYGFGADALGDLFVSFSPTITSPAPLVPGTPTVVMSYTRDGIFRWKFTDFSLVGGELAVSRGLLYPENSANAVLTSSGQPAFTLSEVFGRAVVSQLRTIVAPVTGGVSLNGYESGTNSARWKHHLEAGQSFGSDQVRLASWSTRKGPTTVALTFTRKNGQSQLRGIVARDGSEAFTCNVAMSVRTEPQLFEVAEGSLALMEGSDACGKCDPPFAGSSAAFHTLELPYISPATQEPWVGTFGGAGHDHREETLNEQLG